MARLYGDKEFRILRTDLDKSLNCLFCVEVFMNFDEFLQDAKERIVDLEKWDHPRMCGNNSSFFNISMFVIGITPACAGTTSKESENSFLTGDHPRMCGNNYTSPSCINFPSGSPPHVREQRPPIALSPPLIRITPACAGTTVVRFGCQTPKEDHPRMCGNNLHIETTTIST